MRFMSVKFPDNFKMVIPLHSRNVLVVLELWHGARACIKIYALCGNTTHSHKSVFRSHNNRSHFRHFRVWYKQNEKYHA